MNSKGKCPVSVLGTHLACMRMPALLMAAGMLFMGCLVTEKVELTLQPNTPSALYQPTALAADEPSVQSIYAIDLDTFPFSEINLRAIIYDPDIDQSLDWKLFVDFDPDSPTGPIDFDTVAPSEGEDPEWRFDLDSDELLVGVSELGGAGCHKLELRVSSEFESSFPGYDPAGVADPVPDVGALIWWVSITDAANPTVDISTCP